MDISPIHNKQDYNKALKRIELLMDASINTPEGDELEVLSTLVESFENKQFPIEEPNPIEALKFRMEQQDISRKELEEVMHCSRARISEIINKKRPLSLSMIRSLNSQLNIPAESLIKEYSLNV